MAYGRRERLRSTFALSGTPSQQDGSIDGSSRSRTRHVRVVPGRPGAGRSAAAHPVPGHLDRAGRDHGRLGPLPVGLLDGPPGRRRAGHAAVGIRGVPAVLGHVPRDRRPLRRRRGRSDADRPGRHPGDDQRPRRPVLGLPDLRRVPREPARDRRPVRGDRRRDRIAGAGWHGRLLAARRRLPPRRHQAARGVAGREGGRHDRRHRGLGRWHDARRPDGRWRAGPDPRPEGIGRQARRPARRRADPADDHP